MYEPVYEEWADQFVPDDYEAVNEEYFKEIRESGEVAADISGWLDTYSYVQDEVPKSWLLSSCGDIQTYRIDEGRQLRHKKEPVVDLISSWEQRTVDYDEVTLCPSATAGSLLVMAALAECGVRTIVFETPAYYATLQQAEMLGLRAVKVPTYLKNGFQLDFERRRIPDLRIALWLTHPRVSLGLNQNLSECLALLEQLNEQDYLVIDEATEQNFPALLSALGPSVKHPNVLRIRNFFKPFGLNGPRLCFVLHSRELRPKTEYFLATCHGPMDCFSLDLAGQFSAHVSRFAEMLSIANQQTTELREKAERLARGSRITIIPLENGYIGCAACDLAGFPGTYAVKRSALLTHCRDVRMPVILGAQMAFAVDPLVEFIRINYFNREHHITRGLSLLRDFTPRE